MPVLTPLQCIEALLIAFKINVYMNTLFSKFIQPIINHVNGRFNVQCSCIIEIKFMF